jgi:protoporphyrinogen oxidase
MKIGIIGAGFTGLSAAYYLTKSGHDVVIFEKDDKPGGLAVGYSEHEWDWALESHYHHWFTNDRSILKLAREINHKVLIRQPKTSSFVSGKIFQFDSPLSLLKFPKLNVIDRIRMGASLAFLRYNPVWHPLEKFQAVPYLKKSMGEKSYKMLWEPLMKNKLGKYAEDVSLAWFWARVYKRTQSLAYPEGGFLSFAQHLQKEIEARGGKFHYNTEVQGVTLRRVQGGREGVVRVEGIPTRAQSNEVSEHWREGEPATGPRAQERQDPEQEEFDKVIVTLPSFFFLKIAPDLPASYKNNLLKLKGLGALNLVLRLKKKFLTDNTYWLNMCDSRSPILAIVEHTNFMNKKHYNNEHIVYLGNYLEQTDPRFKMTAQELLKLYDPWLKKINPNYKSSIINYKLFRAPFAQPIIPTNYSKLLPPFETPLRNIFLANIQQVYPWDRGTNYAVELGMKISKIIGK